MNTRTMVQSEMEFDLEADGEAELQAKPTDDQLRSIAAITEEYLALRARMDKAELWLKEAKARCEEVEATILPELMDSVGIAEFTLSDGTEIRTKPIVAGSITKKNQVEAFAWLRKNGYGVLIKSIISVSLGKGTDTLGEKAVKALEKMGLEVDRKESVHAQTLGAWAREIIAEGKSIPLDLLGIYVGKRATVKQPAL